MIAPKHSFILKGPDYPEEVCYIELSEDVYVKIFTVQGVVVCLDIDLSEYAGALSIGMLVSNEF